MGGVSTGNFSIPGAEGLWQGNVKVVPKLQQPGFCRVDAKLTALLGKDVSGYDGLTYNVATDGAPIKTMMAVIEGGLLERFQFTAPLHAQDRQPMGAVFVPFSSFKPFGIRPEPGNGPSKQQLKHLTSVGLLADGTTGDFKVEFGEIAATSAPAPGPSPPGPPAPAAGIDLFQFGRPGVKPWKVTNDPVMGGQSKSTFVVGKDGAGAANVGLFAGDVAIVPSLKAPGFCNAYVEINKVDMSAYDGTRNTMASTSNFPNFFYFFLLRSLPPKHHHQHCCPGAVLRGLCPAARCFAR